MIRTLFPRIIVTDIVLPRLSGLELLDEVMRYFPITSPRLS